MGKSIAVFNQKGGVGKTTTNVNLSASIGKLGKKVLVLDMDPQGNTTSGYGIDKDNIENTIYEVIIENLDIRDAIIKTEFENIDIIPSASELSGAEIELANEKDREFKLRNSLYKIKDQYDFIFIDCPPSLGVLTINALTAVDSVLIPIQCEFYALEGVGQLINTIQLVKKSLNKSLDIEGVLMTMYDYRTNLSNEVYDEAKKFFNDKVYDATIARNIRLAEAPSFGLPIMLYDDKCKGAIAYKKFAKEFLSKQ